MQQKALDCLHFASLPIASKERLDYLRLIEAKYSTKAILTKVNELKERGYIEPLLSGTACGNLTEKGTTTLRERT